MLSTAELVTLLGHANGWHRDTAARLLHQRQDLTAVAALHRLVESAPLPATRWLAMQVLRGLNALSPNDLGHALHDADSDVRTAAVRLGAAGESDWAAMAEDPSARVRAEVGWALVGT